MTNVNIPPSIEGGPVEAGRTKAKPLAVLLIPPSIEGGPVEALFYMTDLVLFKRHSALN